MICWLIVLSSAAFVAEEAWKGFNQAERGDGNAGHTTIDFGGQWLMGRMIVEGQGRHLYDRRYLRPVAHKGYPAGVERPDADKGDAESMMDWLSGTDDSKAPAVVASFLGPLAAQNGLEESALLASARRPGWRSVSRTSPRRGWAERCIRRCRR